MNNTCRVRTRVYSFVPRLVSVLFLIFLFLVPLSPSKTSGKSAEITCTPDPHNEIATDKNLPLGCEMTLSSSFYHEIQGNPLLYEWYGPFSPSTISEPEVFMPEGTHAVSLLTFDGVQRSAPHVLYITVDPAFSISAAAKKGKVVVTWPHVQGATRFDIYRAKESDPSRFEKIAELPAATTSYTNVNLCDATYLYAVGALSNRQWLYSQVKSSHPYLTSPMCNYPPVIYSAPITKGIVGLKYTYDVQGSDPLGDMLTYSLLSPPAGMRINSQSGLIEWTPPSLGDYEVTVKVKDCKGSYKIQKFIIEVDELPDINRNPIADAGGPYAAEVGQPISFDGSSSYDPDGDPLLYAWIFGDGSSGNGASPSHAYGAPGTYQVTLTVSDGRGGTATDATTASIQQCLPPTVGFSSNPAAIRQGESCTLLWTSKNASTLSIDHGIGDVGASGTITIQPQATTTYTITATGRCGTAAESVTVIVHSPPVVHLTAVPGSIAAGQTSKLSWTSENADTVTIDQGIGPVTPNGSLAVAPTSTTTYTITASGPGGTATDSATITVYQPPHVSLTSQPQAIAEGGASILTWTSENADSAFLDNGLGNVAVNGSLAVSPAETTTYAITVQGPGGTATASASVTVLHKPAVIIAASPDTIDAGETATLTWTSTNADSASLDQGIGAVEVNGSLQVSPSETTTYTITATSPGGIATASVPVGVNHPQLQRKACAYITNMESGDVTVVDISTNSIITRIPVGTAPYGVAVSPDGDRVYIACGGSDGGIYVIDTITNTVAGTIEGIYATTLAVNPDGSIIYAVSAVDGTLTAIDAHSHGVIGVVQTGPSPFGIAVKPDGTRIYITSMEDGTMRVIDAATLAVIDTVQIVYTGKPLWDVEVSPDGAFVYVVSSDSCLLAVIDTNTDAFVNSHFYMPERHLGRCYLAVSPDGNRIYLSINNSTYSAGSVYVIDTLSLGVVNRITAVSPSDLSFTPDGTFLYVPDSGANGVMVIDSGSDSAAAFLGDDFSRPTTCGHFITKHRERITGRIVADGAGVEGIMVTLTDGRMTWSCPTDAQGRYIFYAPPGSYTLFFSGRGYAFAQQNLAVNVSDREISITDTEVLLGVKIWSEPGSIASGRTALLLWSSIKASSITIDQGIGSVGTSGSYAISPNETTTYTITAFDGQGRTVTDQVTVTVFPQPQVNISAEPQVILKGQPATLSWTSTNADTLTLGPYGWNLENIGSITVFPQETTTYTITASGPGGIATASATVTVYEPPQVTISANPQTIYAGESSLLTWSSSNVDHVSIDNGIGNVEPGGSMTVNPAKTTTYTITASGPGGVAEASATLTVNSIISLHIDSPAEGALIDRPDILVKGTMTNVYGNETGVTVNGVPAVIHGDRFFVNHVPLSPGENSLIVRAADVQGNASEVVIPLDCEVTGPYITLSVNDAAGISPFESILRVESFFEPDSLTFSDSGPGQIEYLDGSDTNERLIKIPNAGVYFITARVYKTGVLYTDTIGTVVHDRTELDGMLRQKWAGMRTALLNNDIDTAVKDISSRTKNIYRNAFGYLTDSQRSSLVNEIGDIRLIKMRGTGVEYDIQTTRDGTLYSYILLFDLDEDGMWKVANF
ncbi:MAG: PKD domain-containing protein [Desulfomonilia bacterium]|jgi:YVTN family beta-propeller protein